MRKLASLAAVALFGLTAIPSAMAYSGHSAECRAHAGQGTRPAHCRKEPHRRAYHRRLPLHSTHHGEHRHQSESPHNPG